MRKKKRVIIECHCQSCQGASGEQIFCKAFKWGRNARSSWSALAVLRGVLFVRDVNDLRPLLFSALYEEIILYLENLAMPLSNSQTAL